MGCKCKSNRLMEEKISKQLQEDFEFEEKKQNITEKVLFFMFRTLLYIIGAPIFIGYLLFKKIFFGEIELKLKYFNNIKVEKANEEL